MKTSSYIILLFCGVIATSTADDEECQDTNGTFEINRDSIANPGQKMEKRCGWLATNMDRINRYCDRADVKDTCPFTCCECDNCMITCNWVREKPLARCYKEVSEKCPFTCNSCPLPLLPFQSTAAPPNHFLFPTILSIPLVAVFVSLTAFFLIRKKVKMENRKEALRQLDGRLGIESISSWSDRDLILYGYCSWDIEMDHDWLMSFPTHSWSFSRLDIPLLVFDPPMPFSSHFCMSFWICSYIYDIESKVCRWLQSWFPSNNY